MTSACETDEIIRDFFFSAYTSPLCLAIIRGNDAERAQKVFAQYRPQWTSEQFSEAEILVSGVEYATLMPAGTPVSLQTRIEGALHNILGIYGVPEDVRNTKIQKVFAMDYQNLCVRVLADFKKYVADTNEHTFKTLLKR